MESVPGDPFTGYAFHYLRSQSAPFFPAPADLLTEGIFTYRGERALGDSLEGWPVYTLVFQMFLGGWTKEERGATDEVLRLAFGSICLFREDGDGLWSYDMKARDWYRDHAQERVWDLLRKGGPEAELLWAWSHENKAHPMMLEAADALETISRNRALLLLQERLGRFCRFAFVEDPKSPQGRLCCLMPRDPHRLGSLLYYEEGKFVFARYCDRCHLEKALSAGGTAPAGEHDRAALFDLFLLSPVFQGADLGMTACILTGMWDRYSGDTDCFAVPLGRSSYALATYIRQKFQVWEVDGTIQAPDAWTKKEEDAVRLLEDAFARALG